MAYGYRDIKGKPRKIKVIDNVILPEKFNLLGASKGGG
jgi:hypothetical protein